MAQINIALEQDEILLLLADSGGDAFRVMLQESLNAVLRAESAEQLRAAPYERTEERTDSRKIYYGTTCEELERRVPALVSIARAQRLLREAA